MSKFLILWSLAAVSHFATAQNQLPQVAAPPGATLQFQQAPGQALTTPQPVPSDLGPPGAYDATVAQQQAAQQAYVQQQARAWAAQQSALQKPNIGKNTQDPGSIMNALMGMFGGGTGGKSVPNPYLPNGQINPEFQSYVQGGGQLPANEYEYSNNFKPDYNRAEVKISPSEMCKYPVANAKKNFAGHNCDERSKDRMTCMVCNIYFEGNDEPPDGQIAIGRSSLRRLFSSYANPGEGLCQVVYRQTRSKRTGALVGQYSWTHEKKDHTLKAGKALDRVVDSALKAFCAGPSEFTNYFAPSIVNPDWNRSGECATGPRKYYPGPTGGHQFCSIRGAVNRSVAEVMASEGVSLSHASSDDPALGAQ